MLMLVAALFAHAAVAAPKKPSGHVGACAWARLERADRNRVLDAYDRDRSEGLTVLTNLEEPVAAALKACAPKGRVAAVFLHRAIWAEMTQAGAAREIAVTGPDRDGLDAAWSAAPLVARACLHNRLGPNFGQLTPACADDAEGQISRSLSLGRPELRLQASVYFVAKAEAEWAEQLIANSPF